LTVRHRDAAARCAADISPPPLHEARKVRFPFRSACDPTIASKNFQRSLDILDVFQPRHSLGEKTSGAASHRLEALSPAGSEGYRGLIANRSRGPEECRR